MDKNNSKKYTVKVVVFVSTNYIIDTLYFDTLEEAEKYKKEIMGAVVDEDCFVDGVTIDEGYFDLETEEFIPL